MTGGADNPVVVQLTEEQLQLLVNAEHLTDEIVQAHQQSNLHEIRPEVSQAPVGTGEWNLANSRNDGNCISRNQFKSFHSRFKSLNLKSFLVQPLSPAMGSRCSAHLDLIRSSSPPNSCKRVCKLARSKDLLSSATCAVLISPN